MANTWNRSGTTWGQGLWGEQDSNLIDLTGISASFSIGTAVAFSEQGWVEMIGVKNLGVKVLILLFQ